MKLDNMSLSHVGADSNKDYYRGRRHLGVVVSFNMKKVPQSLTKVVGIEVAPIVCSVSRNWAGDIMDAMDPGLWEDLQ